jgi:hypothetical protein
MIGAAGAAAARVLEILEAKGRDYAGDGDPWRCFNAAELAGVHPARSILVRAIDKISRAGNLLETDPAVAGEALEDTADDLIGYALLFRAWLATHEGG